MTYFLIALLVVALIFLGYANAQLRLFYLPGNKLRVLEYHSVSTDGFENQVTISREKLIAQFEYLKVNGYRALWLSEIDDVLASGKKLPPKSVVLTFDDGYRDNFTVLYPLLKEYDFKAVCFMVLGRIGQNIDWAGQYVNDTMPLMDKPQLLEIGSHVELAHHTYKHDNYTKISFDEIEKDLELCNEVIEKEGLNVFPALAYTYGRYYRRKDQKQKQFFGLLEKHGIRYAFRIGNRINIFPFRSRYDLQRIDIRGFDSMADFKTKLVYGRKKLF